MAEDSDGTLKAVVICEGDLHDPDFPKKFRSLLGKLKSILDPPKRKKRFLKVNKVEPWNSVRVTLSIPKEAASKLRQLAAEGNTALRALGILSVQLEGDTVISLRLVGQEIVLRTEADNTQVLSGQAQSSAATNDFTNLLARVPTPQNNQQSQQLQQTICAGGGEGPSGLSSMKSQIVALNSAIDPSALTNGPSGPLPKSVFKSPNTICPMDGKLPTPVPSNVIDSREYPFESMTQARVIHRRENTMGAPVAVSGNSNSSAIGSPPFGSPPPPPYPSASPTPTRSVVNASIIGPSLNATKMPLNQQASTSGNIAISSPLLVNLLQNESSSSSSNAAKMLSTNANTNINQSNVAPVTPPVVPTTIVKNGQEIVILSNNNSMSHQTQHQQVNQSSNFVVTANSGTELGFNKCVVSKQTIQTQQHPQQQQQQQIRVPHQMHATQQTFVSVGAAPSAVTSDSMHPQQQQTLIHNNSNLNNNNLNNNNNNNNNSNNKSARIMNNSSNSVLSAVPQQQTNIVIAGNASVPSSINNVSKIQSRFPQQQPLPPQLQEQQTVSHPQQYQTFTNQPQMRAAVMSGPIASQNQQFHHQSQPLASILSTNMPPIPSNASPQLMSAHVAMQKQQQLRALQSHQNMVAQQQIVGTNLRPGDFRQATPSNVMIQSNPIQMQPFQQQQPGNILQFHSNSGSQHITPQQQQQQQQQQQIQPIDQSGLSQSTYNSRWPLKPMDSATQSSFQEFTRYQMQYNLSQQQQSTSASDPIGIADQLADLDEITRTDLESLLPSINDTDLDSALGLDIKAPLESLLDTKDLVLDLIDPSVANEPIVPTPTSLFDGTGIPSTNAVRPVQGNVGDGSSLSQHLAPVHHQTQLQQQLQMQATIQQPQLQTQTQTQNHYQMPKPTQYPQTDILHTHLQQNTMLNASSSGVGLTTMPKPQQKQHLQTQHQQQQKFSNNNKFEQKPKSVGGKEKQILINPLTGELEPIPSEESGDELPTVEATTIFTEFNSEVSNSMYSDDENSCSTGFSKTASDHSDNERSSNSEHSTKSKTSFKRKERKESTKKPKAPKEKSSKNSLLKEKLQQGLKEKILGKAISGSGKLSGKDKTKIKTLPSPPIISNASIAETGDKNCPEKIKLRLKLEKSEPVTSAYKVDVSFGQSPKRALSNSTSAKTSSTTNITSTSTSHSPSTVGQTGNISASPASEELRVPPLHISLRGRNSVVIKNSKKDRKKSQSGGEEDDSKKSSSKKNNSSIINASSVESPQQNSAHNRLHHNSSESSANAAPNLNVTINEVRMKTVAQSNSLQKFKQQFGENVMVEKVIVNHIDKAKIIKQLELKQQENGNHLTKTIGGTDCNTLMKESETGKRTYKDLLLSSNGPMHPEKKRRLSQGTATTSIADNAAASSSSLSSSTSVSSMMNRPMTDSSVESIREAIGSTNVGTLPKHSSLSSTKIQKGNNNNNNSSTFNKIKTVNKLKSKSLITMLKQHSGRAVGTNKNITVVVKPKPIATIQQGTTDVINEDKFKQKFLDATIDTISASNNTDGSQTHTSTNHTSLVSVANAPTKNYSTDDVENCLANIATTPVTSASSELTINAVNDSNLKQTTIAQNTHYSNRPPEAKDSPKRDPIDGLISASQTVRCSPASQAQGEDSGIESMDALSEKSPHQSASPQANDTKRADSPKVVVTKLTTEEQQPTKESADKYSNIEAALAKMEGINEFMSTVCDKSTIAADKVCDSQKLNGDHSPMQDDKKIELLVNDLVASANSKKDDILLNALQQSDRVHGKNAGQNLLSHSINAIKEESKDMNENKTMIEILDTNTGKNLIEVSLQTKDHAKPIADADKQNIKIEMDENSDRNREISVSLKDESICETKNVNDQKLHEVKGENEFNSEKETAATTVEAIVECNQSECVDIKSEPIKSDEDKEIEETMNAMEVDLAAPSQSNTSKMLQQLLIEIPVGENENAQRIRTRASSKLESPLDVSSKQSPSDSPASNCTKSTKLSTAAVDRLSPKQIGKGVKRKRQGSESSNQSSISDDTPIRGKKARKSGDATMSSSTSSSPTNITATPSPSSSTNSTVNKQGARKSIESGKLNSGGQSKEINSNNVPNLYESENVANKKAEDSSDSDEPLIEVAGKVRNAKICKVVIETDKVLRNHQKSTIIGSNTQSNTGCSASSMVSSDSQAASTKHLMQTKSDDKTCTMSTRRSVRMTMNATATKVTNKSSAGLNNHGQITAQNSTASNSNENSSESFRKTGNGQHLLKNNLNASVGLNLAGNLDSTISMEARRKTRSAGLETMIEGRRRRLSRDSK